MAVFDLLDIREGKTIEESIQNLTDAYYMLKKQLTFLFNGNLDSDNVISAQYAKIAEAFIDELIVGKNVKMGPDARISWSQVTGTEEVSLRQDLIWDNIGGKPTNLLTQSQLESALQNYVTTGTMTDALANTLNLGNFSTIITKDYIASMNLIVGNEILMGANATITWAQVTGTQDIPLRSDLTWGNIGNKPTDLLTQSQLVTALQNYVTTGQMTTALADTLTKGNFNTIITKDYIASMNLVVGNEILMGPNATISWLNVSNKPSAADIGALPSSTFNDFITTYNTKIGDIQSQIDGSITTWFYAYAPTMSNAPASSWTTTELLNQHLGDLFYNTSTGYVYRFALISSTYQWQIITDTDITLALSNAAKAQDTADHKRRVFASTPTPPYDIGDLWSEGPTGDLKVCSTAKASGQTYSASDWDLATKYTDNSALNSFISSTYATDKSSFQTQVDGKIETWYQTTDPNTWAVADRAKHNGDMWYNTSTRELKRYNSSTNGWDLIQDQLSIDAYSMASTAKDTADHKRRVFTTTPTPPYDVGDLWAGGTSSDLQRCIVAKASGGTYAASDWERATKYIPSEYTNAQAIAAWAASQYATHIDDEGVYSGSFNGGMFNINPTGDSELQSGITIGGWYNNGWIGQALKIQYDPTGNNGYPGTVFSSTGGVPVVFNNPVSFSSACTVTFDDGVTVQGLNITAKYA